MFSTRSEHLIQVKSTDITRISGKFTSVQPLKTQNLTFLVDGFKRGTSQQKKTFNRSYPKNQSSFALLIRQHIFDPKTNISSKLVLESLLPVFGHGVETPPDIAHGMCEESSHCRRNTWQWNQWSTLGKAFHEEHVLGEAPLLRDGGDVVKRGGHSTEHALCGRGFEQVLLAVGLARRGEI